MERKDRFRGVIQQTWLVLGATLPLQAPDLVAAVAERLDRRPAAAAQGDGVAGRELLAVHFAQLEIPAHDERAVGVDGDRRGRKLGQGLGAGLRHSRSAFSAESLTRSAKRSTYAR